MRDNKDESLPAWIFIKRGKKRKKTKKKKKRKRKPEKEKNLQDELIILNVSANSKSIVAIVIHRIKYDSYQILAYTFSRVTSRCTLCHSYAK